MSRLSNTPLRRILPPAVPRIVLAVTLAGALIFAVGGAFLGRAVAPKPASPDVAIQAAPAPAASDPIVRPQRLEIPQ